MEVAQSCQTLCDPMDYSLRGSSIHGIFQARVLDWVTISFSRGSSWPRDQTQVSRIVGKMLYYLRKPGQPKVEVLSCSVILTNSLRPHRLLPPGFSVRGILQARILEWLAIPFSRGSSQPRNWTQVSHIALQADSLPSEPLGKVVVSKLWLNK